MQTLDEGDVTNFRVAVTGVIVEMNSQFKVMKKLKLIEVSLEQMIYGSKKVNAEKIISECCKNKGRDTGITDSIIEANHLARKGKCHSSLHVI